MDAAWLFASLFPSGLGFVLFVYGKKEARWPQLFAGLAFMVYPFFTPTITAMTAIGLVLGVGLWVALRAGW
jgi:hypothetical protein